MRWAPGCCQHGSFRINEVESAAEVGLCCTHNAPVRCPLGSQGNAEALDRWGGKTKHRLISYFLSKTSAKNYRNRFVSVKIIASWRWDVFWYTVYRPTSPIGDLESNRFVKKLMAYQELVYFRESGVKSGLACVYGRNLADLTKGMRGRERGSAGCSVCEFVSPRSSSIGPGITYETRFYQHLPSIAFACGVRLIERRSCRGKVWRLSGSCASLL